MWDRLSAVYLESCRVAHHVVGETLVGSAESDLDQEMDKWRSLAL